MRGTKVCRAKCQKYLAEWIHASILQGFFYNYNAVKPDAKGSSDLIYGAQKCYGGIA